VGVKTRENSVKESITKEISLAKVFVAPDTKKMHQELINIQLVAKGLVLDGQIQPILNKIWRLAVSSIQKLTREQFEQVPTLTLSRNVFVRLIALVSIAAH
jgi:hypothetical protein